MSVQSPPPARAVSLRVGLRRRIEQWRADVPTLQLATIALGGRIRVALSRELDSLVAEYEVLSRIVDDMALATDGRAWHSARDRGEEGWSDLVARTADLRVRIERQRRRSRPGTAARRHRAAALEQARRRGPRLEATIRRAEAVEARPEPATRSRGLLARWGTLIRNEGLKLQG